MSVAAMGNPGDCRESWLGLPATVAWLHDGNDAANPATSSEVVQTGCLDLLCVRMLAIGVYAPSCDGFDLNPTRCRKWIQSNYAIDHRRDKLVPTIVGEADNLPDGAWDWLEERLERTNVMAVTGHPRAAATDLPTWHLEIVTPTGRHRLHAYGAGVIDPRLRAVNLAIGIIEQFAGRIPWTEHLESQAVKPTSEQMADLLR